jgi:hypothetical protein
VVVARNEASRNEIGPARCAEPLVLHEFAWDYIGVRDTKTPPLGEVGYYRFETSFNSDILPHCTVPCQELNH